jgi:hypothetical protein
MEDHAPDRPPSADPLMDGLLEQWNTPEKSQSRSREPKGKEKLTRSVEFADEAETSEGTVEPLNDTDARLAEAKLMKEKTRLLAAQQSVKNAAHRHKMEKEARDAMFMKDLTKKMKLDADKKFGRGDVLSPEEEHQRKLALIRQISEYRTQLQCVGSGKARSMATSVQELEQEVEFMRIEMRHRRSAGGTSRLLVFAATAAEGAQIKFPEVIPPDRYPLSGRVNLSDVVRDMCGQENVREALIELDIEYGGFFGAMNNPKFIVAQAFAEAVQATIHANSQSQKETLSPDEVRRMQEEYGVV